MEFYLVAIFMLWLISGCALEFLFRYIASFDSHLAGLLSLYCTTSLLMTQIWLCSWAPFASRRFFRLISGWTFESLYHHAVSFDSHPTMLLSLYYTTSLLSTHIWLGFLSFNVNKSLFLLNLHYVLLLLRPYYEFPLRCRGFIRLTTRWLYE